jgi:hypothetical protein
MNKDLFVGKSDKNINKDVNKNVNKEVKPFKGIVKKIKCVTTVFPKVATPQLMDRLSVQGVSVFPTYPIYFNELRGKMQNRYVKLSEEGRRLVLECEAMSMNVPVLSANVFSFDMLRELSVTYNKARVLYKKNKEFMDKVATFKKVFDITSNRGDVKGRDIMCEVERIKSISDSMKIFNDNLLVQLNEYKISMPLAIDIFIENYFEDVLLGDLGGKYVVGGSYAEGILEGQPVIQLHVLEGFKKHINHAFWCNIVPYAKFPNGKYTKYLVENKDPINSQEFKDNYYNFYPEGIEKIAYGIYGLSIKHLQEFLKKYLMWEWVNQEDSHKPSL